MNYSKRLHAVIPGGAHTYSRGDDQYPLNAPQILKRGKGCYVWDASGKKFLDYGMALRAVTIGYAYKPVYEAAFREIKNGNNLTRPSVVELEAAELLTKIIPSAEMVKFAKNGSVVTTAAVKLARAYTGRKYIAVCSEHPFFSYDDWFIGSTIVSRGIPKEISDLTLKFHYNDIESLKQLFKAYPKQIAGVILEPVTTIPPQKDFLQNIKTLCHKEGAVFILDEMISGFRWHMQGAQTYFHVKPDLCTFGKGMANGFSVAALAGKREIMNLGGILDEGAERVFLISTTHGAEMAGMGAFVRTMSEYKKLHVVDHLWKYGKKLIDGMNGIAKELGIQEHFLAEGYPCSPGYITKDEQKTVSLPFRTLFSQEMIHSGILMPWIALSYSHTDIELQKTLSGVEKALRVYKNALNFGWKKYLKGPSIKPVFRKEN